MAIRKRRNQPRRHFLPGGDIVASAGIRAVGEKGKGFIATARGFLDANKNVLAGRAAQLQTKTPAGAAVAQRESRKGSDRGVHSVEENRASFHATRSWSR